MTIKELRKYLEMFEPSAEVLVACDEELNTIYEKFEVAVLGQDDDTIKQVVFYGLSGSEIEEDNFSI